MGQLTLPRSAHFSPSFCSSRLSPILAFCILTNGMNTGWPKPHRHVRGLPMQSMVGAGLLLRSEEYRRPYDRHTPDTHAWALATHTGNSCKKSTRRRRKKDLKSIDNKKRAEISRVSTGKQISVQVWRSIGWICACRLNMQNVQNVDDRHSAMFSISVRHRPRVCFVGNTNRDDVFLAASEALFCLAFPLILGSTW